MTVAERSFESGQAPRQIHRARRNRLTSGCHLLRARRQDAQSNSKGHRLHRPEEKAFRPPRAFAVQRLRGRARCRARETIVEVVPDLRIADLNESLPQASSCASTAWKADLGTRAMRAVSTARTLALRRPVPPGSRACSPEECSPVSSRASDLSPVMVARIHLRRRPAPRTSRRRIAFADDVGS
jgi:hypothetical protein